MTKVFYTHGLKITVESLAAAPARPTGLDVRHLIEAFCFNNCTHIALLQSSCKTGPVVHLRRRLIAELRAAGCTLETIAHALDRDVSSITYHLRQMKLTGPTKPKE